MITKDLEATLVQLNAKGAKPRRQGLRHLLQLFDLPVILRHLDSVSDTISRSDEDSLSWGSILEEVVTVVEKELDASVKTSQKKATTKVALQDDVRCAVRKV